MPYKEINIKVRIINGRIGTKLEQNFPEDVESIHTVIGIMENIKQQQLEKLKNEDVIDKRKDGI